MGYGKARVALSCQTNDLSAIIADSTTRENTYSTMMQWYQGSGIREPEILTGLRPYSQSRSVICLHGTTSTPCRFWW